MITRKPVSDCNIDIAATTGVQMEVVSEAVVIGRSTTRLAQLEPSGLAIPVEAQEPPIIPAKQMS